MKKIFLLIILLMYLPESKSELSVQEIRRKSSAPWVGASLEGRKCDGNRQGYGPFDYMSQNQLPKYNLYIVEMAHFTPKVEQLIKGETGSIGSDLEYTLRAWPNHHKALLSAIRYYFKRKNKLTKDDKNFKPPECFLQRALNFSPKDPSVYSLYGYYLKKRKLLEQAQKFYVKALSIDPKNSKINYSYALLLLDLKQYETANEYAKKSYQYGQPPPGLKNKLKKLGLWTK